MEVGSALEMLGVGVAVILVLVAFRPLVLLFVLLKTQLQKPSYAAISSDDVPSEVRDYLRRGAEPLAELGFTEHAWVRQTSLEWSEHGERPMLVLAHAESGAQATVSPAITGSLLRTNFVAELDDGSWLETAHGETQLLIGPLPSTELVDTADPDPRALWQRFHARLEELCAVREVVRRTPPESAARTELRMGQVVDAWLAGGILQPAREPGRFELRVAHAAKLAVRAASGYVALAKLQAQMKKLQPAPPVVEQVRGFRRVRELTEQRSTRFHLGAVLVVSAALFAVTMLRLVEPGDIGLLLGVLLFHELGHYAAMRALGYRETSIFFIPFFGAAARGTKSDERAHEKLIVLLAGPVPGIALGALLATALPHMLERDWFESLVDLLIIVNLLNLLPIFPLDGGRVVQVIFSNARPSFEVAFRAFGALALLALGLASSDAVVIALALVLLLGVPAVRRTARAVRSIRARGPLPSQEEQRLSLVFSELTTNQPSLPPAQHFAVAMPVAERLRQGKLGVIGSLLWSGAYAGCVVAGLTALLFATLARATAEPALAPLGCGEVERLRQSAVAGAGSYTFECTIDDARTESLVSDVQQHMQLPASSCLRAPWHPKRLGPQEIRARRTIAAVRGERLRVVEDHYEGLDDEGAAPPAPEGVAEAKRAHALVLEKAAAAERAYVAGHADDRDFDLELANAYLAVEASADAQADPHAPNMAALLDRLGRREEGCAAPGWAELTMAWQPDLPGVVKVIAQREDARASGPELARYLCERGCKLRYSLRPRTAREHGLGH